MDKGNGGKEVVNKVIEKKGTASQVILIGHSGGGQAVGDALVTLGKEGIKVDHAVQIGAPREPIKKEYADKVTRVQVKSDVVANFVRFGTEVTSKVGAFVKYTKESFTHKMPETVKVDINVKGQAFGGHSAYFDNSLIKNGINNVKTTVNAFWNKIK